MKNKNVSVGNLIKKAVKEAGYTQSNFENKFNLSKNIISLWASGKRNPSITSLKKIAEATGKPLNFFLENSGNSLQGDNNTIGSNNVSYADAEIMRKYIYTLEEKLAEYKAKEKRKKK